MPTPEENMAAALQRASDYRAAGREDRAATWEASADRYRRIIEAKEKIANAKQNLEEIRKRITPTPTPTPTPIPTPIPDPIKKPITKLIPEEDPIPLTSSLIAETKVSPTPPTPATAPTVTTPPPPPTKTAPIDTILFDDQSMSIEIMTDLIFEDIGGHELLSVSRNDIINGQRVSYTPIKNLGLVQQRYNPNNILGLQATSDKYFANFAIKFDEKIPNEGNGPNGENIYIDPATGDLIIETINMNNDEQLEVQIAINGTIYEANFGEITS